MPRSAAPKRRRPAKKLARVTKTERWLNLLAFLLDRHYPVAREEIFTTVSDYCEGWRLGTPKAKVAVRQRFERDKRELKQLGIVIKPQGSKVAVAHADDEVQAYLLRPRDLYLPYLELGSAPSQPRRPYHLPTLKLKPEEYGVLRRAAERVLALGATPLGPSAASVLRKLSFDLPGVAPGIDEVSLAQPVHPAFEGIFATLREGVEQKVAVRCRYYSIGRDAEEERVIEPYGLMLSWGHWYCIARARERAAMRVFRVDRMRAATLLEGDASGFAVPADFSVRSYLDRAPWELSEQPAVQARVRIAFPHSRWTIAEGLGRVIDGVDAEGGALLEFDVRAPEAFIRWLLPFGAQVELLSPTDLVARLATERERVRALYT
jgi:predicted DNA-binding transcriptional regulator YafY